MSRARLPSRFWAFLFRTGLLRAPMAFWRVVVEAKPDRCARVWADDLAAVVGPVFVWARTIEEAEGLAALAFADLGLELVTADAARAPPAARPRRVPGAAGFGELGYLPASLEEGENGASPVGDART